MTDESPLLDRDNIKPALDRLGERLAAREVVADIYVIECAALALAYDARRATRDIDALFEPHGIVREEADAVAAELGLPRWWLNDQATVYAASGGDSAAPRVFENAGIRVAAASPEHLLAMKVLAARRRDVDDIRTLVKHLGLNSVEEVVAICVQVFEDEPIPDRARLILEDLFEA